MTEAEWNAGEDVGAMLAQVQNWRGGSDPPRRASDRKLRLFACACWRAYRPHWLDSAGPLGLDPNALLRAVIAAEDYADNPSGLLVMSDWPLDGSGEACASETVRRIGDSATVKQLMAALLREVAGNQFRSVTLCGLKRKPFHTQFAHVDTNDGFWLETECPACARLRTPQVLSLAQAAFDERGRKCLACNQWTDCKWCGNTRRIDSGHLDSARLAVLSDALEEAGCPAFETVSVPVAQGVDTRVSVPHPLLSHLRSPGPHVRGCWALDLVLGKE